MCQVHGTVDCVNFMCDEPEIKVNNPAAQICPCCLFMPSRHGEATCRYSFSCVILSFSVAHTDILIDHLDGGTSNTSVQAVAFVGSNTAGEHIYTRASANGKRVQVTTFQRTKSE